MSLLARILRQRRAWLELAEGIPADMEFPAGVISDLYDARGASFWVVSDREADEVRRLVGNLSCTPSSKQLNTMEIRFVPEDVVKVMDIRMEMTKGVEGPDKGFSDRHRDLYVETNGQAVGLAKEMLRIDPIIMTERDVARCIAESIDNGYFDISSINRDLLKALANLGALGIRR
jgi:hypothetical protein